MGLKSGADGSILIEEWRDHCLDLLSSQNCEKDVFNQGVTLARQLGFNFFGTGIQLQAFVSAEKLSTESISSLHYEVADPKAVVGNDEIRTLFERSWSESLRRSTHIAHALLEKQ